MKKRKNNHSGQCWKTIGVFGDSTCPKLADLLHCRNCRDYSEAGKALFDRDIPDGYLDEWTRLFAEEKETEVKGTDSVVVFRLKGEWLALKIAYFQEATEIRPVHTVPFRTSTVFKGLVNISGELIPCVSADDILGLTGDSHNPTERKVYHRMIVVNNEGERFAFHVDEIMGVQRVSPKNDLKSPATVSGSSTALTGGVFISDGITVGLLDEEKFFESLRGSIAY